MGSLTRDQIVNDAIKRAGNESLLTEGREWLNDWLDRLYEDYRWPEQEQVAQGSLAIGDTTVSLPSTFSDLWNRRALRLEDSDSNFHSLDIVTPDFLDTLVAPDLAGEPTHALIDFGDSTWRPYPIPDEAYTWHLRFKQKPVRLTADTAPLFKNDAILKQAVYVSTLQYEDDERYASELTILTRMIELYRKGRNISPNRAGSVPLSSKFSNPGVYR